MYGRRHDASGLPGTAALALALPARLGGELDAAHLRALLTTALRKDIPVSSVCYCSIPLTPPVRLVLP